MPGKISSQHYYQPSPLYQLAPCRNVTICAELIVDKILGVIINPCGTPCAAKPKCVPPCLQGGAAGQVHGLASRGCRMQPSSADPAGQCWPQRRGGQGHVGGLGIKEPVLHPVPSFPPFPMMAEMGCYMTILPFCPCQSTSPPAAFTACGTRRFRDAVPVHLSVPSTVCRAQMRNCSSLLWAAWRVQVCSCMWYLTPPAAPDTALAVSLGMGQRWPRSP